MLDAQSNFSGGQHFVATRFNQPLSNGVLFPNKTCWWWLMADGLKVWKAVRRYFSDSVTSLHFTGRVRVWVRVSLSVWLQFFFVLCTMHCALHATSCKAITRFDRCCFSGRVFGTMSSWCWDLGQTPRPVHAWWHDASISLVSMVQ